MEENNVYTGGTPRPVVTPPIAKTFGPQTVSPTPERLFTAECAGVTGFQFTNVKTTGGSVTFSLYINGSLKTTKPVPNNSTNASFTLSAGTGTNVCMISGTDGATVSGRVDQI